MLLSACRSASPCIELPVSNNFDLEMTWKYSEWLGSIRKVFGFRVIRHIFLRQVFGMPKGAFGMSKDFVRKGLEGDLEFSTNFSDHIWSGKKLKFWSTVFFSKNHLELIYGSNITFQGFKLTGILQRIKITQNWKKKYLITFFLHALLLLFHNYFFYNYFLFLLVSYCFVTFCISVKMNSKMLIF